MTVERGEDRRYYRGGLSLFIGQTPNTYLTVALIDPLVVQMQRCLQVHMQRCLQVLLKEAVKHGKPEMNREWDVHVPTATTPGRLYSSYDVITQEYRFALRLDNLVVQQTVKESMYV